MHSGTNITKQPVSQKYCLICSAARSGSTLLDLLLGGHSSAASLGEFSFLGKAIALNQECSCGRRITQCSKWLKVIQHVKRDTNIDLLTDPYRLRQWDTQASVIIDHRQQTSRYLFARKLRSLLCDIRFSQSRDSITRIPLSPSLRTGIHNALYLYEVIASEWNKKIIIDSSKNVHKALAMNELAPQSTKIIYLTRNGKGVYYSRRESGFSRKQSIGGWKQYNQRALRLLMSGVDENNIYRLKYEELVEDLEGTMRSLCQYLGLAFEPNMLQLDKGERHLVNGNRTMFNRGRGVNYDSRWQTGLKGGELDYFERKCGALNRKMGYYD